MSSSIAGAMLRLKLKAVAVYELMSTGSLLDGAKKWREQEKIASRCTQIVVSRIGHKWMVSGHMTSGMYAFAACGRFGTATVHAGTLAERVGVAFCIELSDDDERTVFAELACALVTIATTAQPEFLLGTVRTLSARGRLYVSAVLSELDSVALNTARHAVQAAIARADS